MKRTLFLIFYFLLFLSAIAQTELFKKGNVYSRQDSLRGGITPQRRWWNLLHYNLQVAVDIENRSLSGVNKITYEVLDQGNELQIDLQAPMRILKVSQKGKQLEVRSEGSAHFITLKEKQTIGKEFEITVDFEGVPVAAKNAPWDGGFTWKTDSNGKPFIANANQGIGASVWWPNKDHGYDEADKGLTLSITVPKELVAVGNGRLQETLHNSKGQMTYVWNVTNPINNYGVNINIGDYVNFNEKYSGEKGELDLDFWVLRENLEKAKVQFKDVIRTIQALEYWFGPYPFYEDSYKLVEVPYLGMEHQSSVTYGNSYGNGYNGRNRQSFDWSNTGWGLKWDYIIIHESGHEWFANNITAKDPADWWIHEAFTAYSEGLFLDYHYGEKAASEYIIGCRTHISNKSPLIGDYGVNNEGSSDIYWKGSNLLHTIRQIVDNDELWRSILRGLNSEFYHQTVTTSEIEKFISLKAGIDFSKVFDQYLRDYRLPKLEYKLVNDKILYRWVDVIEDFSMSLDVIVDDIPTRINPNREWSEISGKKLSVDINYYILSQKVN